MLLLYFKVQEHWRMQRDAEHGPVCQGRSEPDIVSCARGRSVWHRDMDDVLLGHDRASHNWCGARVEVGLRA